MQTNDTDFYDGLPSDLEYWVSKMGRGKDDNPKTRNKTYMIYKTTGDSYKLQETTWNNPESNANLVENRNVAEGALDDVIAEYKERTWDSPIL